MAIANYEDRFVIPSTHREYAENAFDVRGGCGFVRQRLFDGASETSLFGGTKRRTIPIKAEVDHGDAPNRRIGLRVLSRLLAYPDATTARADLIDLRARCTPTIARRGARTS